MTIPLCDKGLVSHTQGPDFNPTKHKTLRNKESTKRQSGGNDVGKDDGRAGGRPAARERAK